MKQPVKQGVKDLIHEYFKIEILETEILTDEVRQNIIDTFTFAYNRHCSIKSIAKELQNSNLSELRDRIIKRMGSDYNAFPVRLGTIKPKLQMEAMENDKSLHGWVLTILRDHVSSK